MSLQCRVLSMQQFSLFKCCPSVTVVLIVAVDTGLVTQDDIQHGIILGLLMEMLAHSDTVLPSGYENRKKLHVTQVHIH